MKKFNIILLLVSILMVGCMDETFEVSTNEPEADAIGYLSLSSLQATLIEESEDFEDESHNSAVASKSSSTPELIVSLVHQTSNEELLNMTYSEVIAQENLELTPGTYTMSIYPEIQNSGWGFDSPTYYGEKEFTIVKNMTTTLDEIKVTLSNIKVTISLSADLRDMFYYEADNASGTNVVTTVSIGDVSYDVGVDETRAVYFSPESTSSVLDISLYGLYNEADGSANASYVETTWVASVSGVKSGQWRDVAIYVDHAYDGNIKFNMSIYDWAYDDEIVVKSMSMLSSMAEEVIPEYDFGVSMENSPSVALLDGGDEIYLSTDSYDDDMGIWNTTLGGTATPESDATISSIEIMVTTENADLLNALAAKGFTDNTFEIYSTNDLPDYFFTKEDGSDVVVKLYPAGLTALSQYSGEHTIMVIVTDSKDRVSYTDYKMTIVNTKGPVLEWLDASGNLVDAEQTYTIDADAGLYVSIDMTSSTGFTGLKVNIISDVLTASVLSSMSLTPEMDLVNPETEDMGTNLGKLGFPVGDSIVGETYLNLNITDFMPMLTALGAGATTFELIATDSTGTSTMEIKVKCE